MKQVPATLGLDVKTKANDQQTSEGFGDWIRVQSEIIREQAGKGLNVVDQSRAAESVTHDA